MSLNCGTIFRILPALVLFLGVLSASAQGGNAGVIRGTVTDPSGAVIPGATVHLTNSSSGVDKSAVTDATGQFEFTNVTFNGYQLAVAANGFAPMRKAVQIQSVVGTTLKLVLQIATADSTVTVQAGGDLVSTDPTFHTEVDRDLFIKVPMESESSGLSSQIGRAHV